MKTDLDGHYRIHGLPAGTYQVCWKASGWPEGCGAEALSVDSSTAYAAPIELAPASPAAVTWGRVVLEDGRPCSADDEFFGIHQIATVQFVSASSGTGALLRTNRQGYWVLPAAPNQGTSLRATCAGSTVITSLLQPTGNSIVLGTVRPRVRRVVVRAGGTEIRSAVAGSVVRLAAYAVSPTAPLRYEWKVPSGSGSIASAAANSATWKLPDARGLHTAFVLVTDGKGGVSQASVSLNVGAARDALRPIPSHHRTPARASDAALWGDYSGRRFLTRYGDEGSQAEFDAYIMAVDPNGTRATLREWWEANNFTAIGEVDTSAGAFGTRAAYFNGNDLGFGRDMRCSQKGAGESADVACYVTNYPDADLAWNVVRGKATATVAMERKSSDRIVKFFAYQGGDGSGRRLPSVALDPFGPKFLPNLCTVCHGGEFLGTAEMGSSFREFDMASFRYPSAAAGSQASQEAAFKQLNEIVKTSQPATAIGELIDGWYAGNSATQITSYVPTGWPAGTQDLYRNVVAKSCRTCHVAISSLSWSTYESFWRHRGSIGAQVCGSAKQMPLALTTYLSFWLRTQPPAPNELAKFTGPNWPTALGVCK